MLCIQKVDRLVSGRDKSKMRTLLIVKIIVNIRYPLDMGDASLFILSMVPLANGWSNCHPGLYVAQPH